MHLVRSAATDQGNFFCRNVLRHFAILGEDEAMINSLKACY